MEEQFSNLSDEQIVAEAKTLYAKAEEIESKADSLKAQASEKKWGVADRCLALAQRGWGQRKIAAEIGMSQKNVSRYVAVASSESVPTQRLPFGEAYAAVDPSAGTLATYRRHAAALVKTDPEGAASIVADHAPAAVAKTVRRRSVSGHVATDREALGRVTDAALRRGRDPVPGAEQITDLADALSGIGRTPADDIEGNVVEIERLLMEVPAYLSQFAGVTFGDDQPGEVDGDGPNMVLIDKLTAQKARLDVAFGNAGIGQSTEDALARILNTDR